MLSGGWPVYAGAVELRAGDGSGSAGRPGLTGYAAVYDVWTVLFDGLDPWDGMRVTVREVIRRGAFDVALSEGQDVRALVNHDRSLILGRTRAQTLRLRSDEQGLFYDVDLPDTQVGRDTAVSVGRRDISGSSFAFVVRDGGDKRTITETDEVVTIDREILSVDLRDVAPVTYPAYEMTTTAIRSGEVAGLVREMRESIAVLHGKRRSAQEMRGRRLRLLGATLGGLRE
jgi:HK97 family phage prohead protease